MPTGYTVGIADGKITTFEQYAWGCARAFGALVTMRDSPSDAPIPEEIKPSDYYTQTAKESTAAYDEFMAFTQDQLEDLYTKELLEMSASHERRGAEKKTQAKRYKDMLALAKEWEPPSPDHVKFKDFMVSQIAESLEFDIYDLPKPGAPPSFRDWKVSKQEKLASAASRAFKSLEEETARIGKANKWLRELRESLKP